MFGPGLLVAPILYSGMEEREVYLPKGSWRDINDGKVYDGERTVKVPAPIDVIPVFARDGALPDLVCR